MRAHLRLVRLGILAGLLVLGLPGVGRGQPQPAGEPAAGAGGAAAQTPAAPAPPAPPKPIPLPDVVDRAEQATAFANSVVQLALPSEAVEKVVRGLDGRGKALEELSRHTDELAGAPRSLELLSQEERDWQRMRDLLSGDDATLTGRISELDAAMGGIEQRRGVWSATRKLAASEGAPASLLQAIRDVDRRLHEAREKAQARRTALLDAQARLAEFESRVTAALGGIAQIRQQVRTTLFERDAPPLWRLQEVPGLESGSGLEAALHSAERQRDTLLSYLASRSDLLLILLLIFSASAWAAWRLGQRAPWASDPRLEASLVIFERPISAALLVTLAVAPLLDPRAPSIFHSTTITLMLVPVLRLLPRLLERALQPTIATLAVAIVIDEVRALAATATTVDRQLLVLEIGLVLAVLLWMMRPARLRALPPDTRLPRVVSRLMRLGGALLAVGLLANIAGYVALARLLGESTVFSAWVALIVYGGVRVIRALVRAGLRSSVGLRLRSVRDHQGLYDRRLSRGIAIGGWILWLALTLRDFTVLDDVVAALRATIGAELPVGAVRISIGDLVAFALTLVGAILLSRFLRFTLETDVLPRFPTGRGVSNAVTTTVNYVVLLVGFMLATAAAGIDFNRFTLLAGALGVGVGFGLQNVVNNFVSGLILLYERPVQLGDTIEMTGLFGEVKRIGVRSSTVRTWQGAEVIVPNANLISDSVINWTLSDRQRRMEVKVGVAYGSDPHQVIELLLGVARAHPDVLEQPAPTVLFQGFGDSSLDFVLRAWTPRFEHFMVTESELTLAVHDALYEAGITIPFPQRDLHLRSIEAEVAQSLSGRDPGEDGGDQ